jgi:hypothetical protein
MFYEPMVQEDLLEKHVWSSEFCLHHGKRIEIHDGIGMGLTTPQKRKKSAAPETSRKQNKTVTFTSRLVAKSP